MANGEMGMAIVLERIAPKTAKFDAGTINWLNQNIERGKIYVFSEAVIVTPGLASELLKRNSDNRNIKPVKAQHFASDMIGGRWTFNGEPIIIAKTGELNAGQHRLTALIEANTSLPFLFVFGVERDSRTTIDQGSARTAGDYLAMEGFHYTALASVTAKYIMAFERSGGTSLSLRSQITNAEVVSRVRADADIVASAAYAMRHTKQYKHLVAQSIIATAHYLLTDIHPTEAETYLNQVCLGENIKSGDPAFAVRSALAGDRKYRDAALEIILHGWNRYRSNQTLQLVRVNGTFPALV
jgi:hypothetical protein